jgi:transcription initiation factor TFIIIB Brf1 subunit/transcription initiation factor TFIIB
MATRYDEELLEFFGDGISERLDAINKFMADTPEEQECKHTDIYDSDGINICRACGCEVNLLDFQPEWRYYGTSDNRSASDPSRCHRSKDTTRGGISKVFQDAKLDAIPLILKRKAELKYKKIVGENTVRGKGRRGIVAACLLYTFYDEEDFRTSDEVRNMFGLSKNEMSSGLMQYYISFPDDRNRVMKPVDMIRRTMRRAKISIDPELHRKRILKLAKCLEGVDPVINRSNPQSVAAAIVYLYICITPVLKGELGLTKNKFAKSVGLSEITITKLVKRAAEIIEAAITL